VERPVLTKAPDVPGASSTGEKKKRGRPRGWEIVGFFTAGQVRRGVSVSASRGDPNKKEQGKKKISSATGGPRGRILSFLNGKNPKRGTSESFTLGGGSTCDEGVSGPAALGPDWGDQGGGRGEEIPPSKAEVA